MGSGFLVQSFWFFFRLQSMIVRDLRDVAACGIANVYHRTLRTSQTAFT